MTFLPTYALIAMIPILFTTPAVNRCLYNIPVGDTLDGNTVIWTTPAICNHNNVTNQLNIVLDSLFLRDIQQVSTVLNGSFSVYPGNSDMIFKLDSNQQNLDNYISFQNAVADKYNQHVFKGNKNIYKALKTNSYPRVVESTDPNYFLYKYSLLSNLVDKVLAQVQVLGWIGEDVTSVRAFTYFSNPLFSLVYNEGKVDVDHSPVQVSYVLTLKIYNALVQYFPFLSVFSKILKKIDV